MIIDNSYFLNKAVYIPHAVAQPSIGGNTPNSVLQLQGEIEEKESEFLVSFLGWEQYAELIDQFEDAAPYAWKPDALQKWKDLVDGKEDWRGLRYNVGNKKISIIAYYVFFHYLASDFSSYSTTGVQVAEAENSTRQLPNGKQVSAWNQMVKMYGLEGSYSRSNYQFSQNWNGTMLQWLGNVIGNETTLYDFMHSRPEDFDTSFFTPRSLVNIYNL